MILTQEKPKIQISKNFRNEWLNLYDIAPYPNNLQTDICGRIMSAEYYDKLRE